MSLTHSEKVPPLHELVPAIVATVATHQLLGDATAKLGAVDPEFAQTMQLTLRLERSPFFRLVKSLVEYAQGGPMPEGMTLDRLIIGVAPLYRSARCIDTLPTDVEPPEPTDAIGLAVMGACARNRLERGAALSCADVAILAGKNKDWITALAASGEIPGGYRDEAISRHKPWRFRVTKSLRHWIEKQR